MCVWLDYLIPLLKKDKELSLVKDEKLKDIYHKYVYVATYVSKMWVRTFIRLYSRLSNRHSSP